MTKSRDPAIKLFGKTIPLTSGGDEGGGEEDKGLSSKREPEAGPGSKKHGDEADGKDDDPTTPVAFEAPKACSDEQETASEKNSKAEEQQSDTSNPQGKPALKKPDKILPCPRCNSLDTKFCYYNNYNVNQPRHFCKNCQRYWTAGGTMRNVPVGAGRRKNKNSAAHYRHLTVSDATLQAIPDSAHPIKPSATVLSFGSSDSPLCESMASVLRLAEKAVKSCARNGFHPTDDGMEEQSSGSLSCAVEEPAAAAGNCRRFGQHMPTYANGSPWPYPWNPAAPIPVPFYPAPAYWGCSVPATWTIPWIPAVANASVVSGPNSTTLGKHSREGDVLRHRSSSDKGDATAPTQGGNLWIPKTLRIDDPEEAAKSSIWTAMGFKNDKADPASGGGGMFRAFQSKAELRNHTVEASRALHANPAAMSRSLNFQESS